MSGTGQSPPVDEEHFRPVTDAQFKIATSFLVLTPIAQVVATFVFFARIYTRAYPTFRLQNDDYLMSIAFVLMTVMWGLQYDSVIWAWGGDQPEFRSRTSVHNALRSAIIAVPFWAWSTGLVKIAIACMLLKFQQAKIWRYFVSSMILINVFFIAWLGIAKCFECTPYQSQWDVSGKYDLTKKCWSPSMKKATTFVTLSCVLISDVVLSLVPLTFLTKVRRPLREKIVIGVLMALGVTASGFSIGRMVSQSRDLFGPDKTALSQFGGVMTCLEVQTSLIAACIPMLRSSANRWLQKVGIWRFTTTNNSRYQRYGPDRDTDPDGRKPSKGVVELDQMAPQGSRKKSKGDTTTYESAVESGQFVMDPVTGRIIRASDSNDHHSMSKLNDEWQGEPGKVIEDEWEIQRGIGHA